MTAPSASILIERAGHALLNAASSPAKVILFGPRVHDESDASKALDFLVIEQELEDRERETTRLRDALRSFEVATNVIVISAADAEHRAKLPGSMVERVLREGRTIAES